MVDSFITPDGLVPIQTSSSTGLNKSVVFIDGPHLFNVGRNLGFNIDFKKLHEYFESQTTTLVRCYYYNAILTAPLEHNPIVPLSKWLSHHGYKVNIDCKSKENSRPDADIPPHLIVDAMLLKDKVDKMTFVVGSDAYSTMIEALQQQAINITIVSTLQGNNGIRGKKIRDLADSFIDLKDISSLVESTNVRVSQPVMEA